MKTMMNVFILALLLLMISCTSDDTVVDPTLKNKSVKDLESIIQVENINLDSIVISNMDDAWLEDYSIFEIQIGLTDAAPGQFTAVDTIIPEYTLEDKKYYLQFNSRQKITDVSSKYQKMTMRFVFSDQSFKDVYIYYETFKYPYKSTKVMVETEIYPGFSEIGRLQSFVFIDDKVYPLTMGATMIYEYDLKMKDSRLLFAPGSGDFITGNSQYLFTDPGHAGILRYNLAIDSVDLYFDLSAYGSRNIWGLAVENNHLYALFDNVATGGRYFETFDFEGQRLSQGELPGDLSFLEVYENVIYTYDNGEILKFDLQTLEKISSHPYPCKDPQGIDIIKDRFYFYDYDRQVISSFELSELD